MDPVMLLALFLLGVVLFGLFYNDTDEKVEVTVIEQVTVLPTLTIETDQEVLNRKCREYMTTDHW